MIDNRMVTFLELCNVMNYRKTAENLNMTQPAVTQHIHHLEEMYGCKLFDYANRKLRLTPKGIQLEKYARSIMALHLSAKEEVEKTEKVKINIGATKTIGDYALPPSFFSIIGSEQYELSFFIDNTENLLNKLDHFDLDLLLVEGYIDKGKYQHRHISTEELVGICAKTHPFANKEVTLEAVFQESIIFREKGSGTRSILENFLLQQGYTLDRFQNKAFISSNKLIEEIVESNLAVSFVYDVIATKNQHLATFRIKGQTITHAFHYVFINENKARKIIELLL